MPNESLLDISQEAMRKVEETLHVKPLSELIQDDIEVTRNQKWVSKGSNLTLHAVRRSGTTDAADCYYLYLPAPLGGVLESPLNQEEFDRLVFLLCTAAIGLNKSNKDKEN